jgi:hypothetical protein
MKKGFAVAVMILAACTVLSLPPRALADGPITSGDQGGSNPPPADNPPAGSGGGQIDVHVRTESHYTGAEPHGDTVPLSSVDTNWSPPGCWFEPRFTPDQYQAYFREGMKGWSTGKEYVEPLREKLEAEQYNRGKDGLWWQITYNPYVSAQYALDHCAAYAEPEQWVPTGDPAPPAGVPRPVDLKDIAYSRVRLPAPPVRLSPVRDNQTVNLPTYVRFAGALGRTYTTAEIVAPQYGIDVAATVVAVPTGIRIDAGTSYAEPRSCTYALTPGAGGEYRVDSSKDDCNVTYRKRGPYTLHAEITWKVTWTPSADPDGPAARPGLPDGWSGTDIPVAVKEIQTVVR